MWVSHVGEMDSLTKTGFFLFHTISIGIWGYGEFVGTGGERVVTSLGNHMYTDTSARRVEALFCGNSSEFLGSRGNGHL